MKSKTSWGKYVLGLLLVALSSAIGEGVHRALEPTNLVMLYLLDVVIAAVFLGRGPAVVTSIVGVLAFDVLFVPPRFSFAVFDTQYLVTFAGLLTVGLIISELASRMRVRTMHALERERKALALYRLSRGLSVGFDLPTIRNIVTAEILTELQSDCVLSLAPENALEWVHGDEGKAAAEWTFQANRKAGFGTSMFPEAPRTYFPLFNGQKTLGVLGVGTRGLRNKLSPQDMQWLETLANQAAVAIERVLLFEDVKKMELVKETEKLQTALLNSISHDLRTPLVSITGTLSHLMRSAGIQKDAVHKELVETACDDAGRLNKLVTNWLDMTRAESGAFRIALEPCDFKDVLGVALRELEHALERREIRVDIPEQIPDVLIDYSLMLKVVVNLLDNAAKYSAPGSAVEISGWSSDGFLRMEFADRGLGIPPEDLQRVFEKFYRTRNAKERNISGTGLGLSIAKAIVEAHGGSIWAEAREGGGTRIVLSLPTSQETFGHEASHE